MDLRSIVLGVGFAVIWASAFTSTRIIVAEMPALLSLSVRFAISGAVGVCIAYCIGQRPKFTPSQWRALLLFGIFQNALYLGLNWSAMRFIEASLAAIIASTMPLIIALIEVLRGRSVPRLALVGMMAGMVGVFLIMGARLSGGADVIGVLLAVMGLFALVVATLVVGGAVGDANVLMAVSLQMFVGAIALVVPALFVEPLEAQITMRGIGALLYASLGPGLTATLLWFTLVRHAGALKAAVFHFLTPFFGVAIAALLLGEELTILDVVGVAIITFGIFCVQVARAGR